jgi:hypothetical protein
MLLEQFAELPMIVFTARYQKPVPGGLTQVSATLSIDKRTGKRLYDSESPGFVSQQQGPFHTLIIDRQVGAIDLISHRMRLRHYVGESGAKAELKSALNAKDGRVASVPAGSLQVAPRNPPARAVSARRFAE